LTGRPPSQFGHRQADNRPRRSADLARLGRCRTGNRHPPVGHPVLV